MSGERELFLGDEKKLKVCLIIKKFLNTTYCETIVVKNNL